jgi:hypothetical protein
MERQREDDMPPLADSREETFAYWRALGFSQTAAARKAGFSHASAHNVGCRLARQAHVQERIQVLQESQQAPIALETGATREWIMTQLIEIVQACRGRDDFSGFDHKLALRALNSLAQLNGYVPPRSSLHSES